MPGATSAPVVARPCSDEVETEVEVNLGALDAPDQLKPTYELWTIRRESWLPPFPQTKLYKRNRESTSRYEE